jgi:CBS domain-containing protein
LPGFCAIILLTGNSIIEAQKGAIMDNILFFLTPKAMCAFVYDDYTIRQALEKMESAGYAALPILNKRGEYRGTLTEGDLLWALKNMCYLDMRQAEARKIMEIARRKDNIAVPVTTTMYDLVQRASTQNFVPVVDDKDAFIGIVTRRAIIKYCTQQLFPED